MKNKKILIGILFVIAVIAGYFFYQLYLLPKMIKLPPPVSIPFYNIYYVYSIRSTFWSVCSTLPSDASGVSRKVYKTKIWFELDKIFEVKELANGFISASVMSPSIGESNKVEIVCRRP